MARVPDERVGYRLMSWWAGSGAARVLPASEGMLLLERASGAGSLSRMAREGHDDKACRILCRTAHKLHAARDHAAPELHPLKDWFQPLCELADRHPAWRGQPGRQGLAGRTAGHPPAARRPPSRQRPGFPGARRLAIDPHGLIGE
ncbi:aminoglycoside phosphotransferase family protein [Caulobacter segnis]|nr:aminoglycoside phosphotransferase family protein [Caulobacter segnis]MDG2520604.1 aminoglycoside phosphotransferase family protein [Caulobacter segnis]